MASSLGRMLASFGWSVERESGTAFFYNHAPWVAPMAYLHIVFKPASLSVLSDNRPTLRLPRHWEEFLGAQNGAILFSGCWSIYGVNAPRGLVNRADFYERSPFSIADENKSWPPENPERDIVIGGYKYDGALAVLNRETGAVSARPRNSNEAMKTWADCDTWVSDEMARLSLLFDESGKRTVGLETTLP